MKLFYDGSCGFCRRRVKWIVRKDKRRLIDLIDISANAFVPEFWGLDNSAWDEPTGLRDGYIYKGPDLVREVFLILDYRLIESWSCLPILSTLFNWACRFVFRFRKYIVL